MAADVWSDPLQAEFRVIANKQIQAIVPNGAAAGNVAVENPGGQERFATIPAEFTIVSSTEIVTTVR
ncbi:MAG: hypothetical protein M2R45_02021 [Verrucomicrobia subdivision 3 bacterium]|nr:hypothetical protein [Limisphaerales bacterium]MCS1414840.1 hypothetical protein [Limisphaerales bacterium]